jgi:DNA-binding transcriptional regulator LsrR (DeoR family)
MPPSNAEARDLENLEFLARVASRYYEDGLTQHQISEELGYSRSAISRFLSKAREVGVVEIRVHHPLQRSAEMENALRERFGLKTVRVLNRLALDYERTLDRIGSLGARLVEEMVNDDTKLGVSWGTAVYEVAHAMRYTYLPNVTVIQLIGALGTPDPQIDGVELARTYAGIFGGRYRILPAPAIVESPEVRNALLADRPIRETLEQARKVDYAIVGIGTTDPSMSSLVRAEYLTEKEIRELADAGAVGDVCAIHFDLHGNILDLPIAHRVVGIRADDLKSIPVTVGVAAGEVKAKAILGALNARLINALVTDDSAARTILALMENSSDQSEK